MMMGPVPALRPDCQALEALRFVLGGSAAGAMDLAACDATPSRPVRLRGAVAFTVLPQATPLLEPLLAVRPRPAAFLLCGRHRSDPRIRVAIVPTVRAVPHRDGPGPAGPLPTASPLPLRVVAE